MYSDCPKNCFIIGEGKFTIECAQLLLQRSCTISGIVSANRDVCNWARDNALLCYHPASNYYEVLAAHPFDYLFSIINPAKVTNQLLALPRKSAINFHDAPLPRYAGLHVTSWAIANREQVFGVTWHEMNSEFDAGDILKQEMFELHSEETAFSLNVRCYELGVKLFEELLDELLGELLDESSSDKVSRQPQDLNERSSYLASKRPENAAIIDWRKSAEAIESGVRALAYTPDVNPLGMPKLRIGEAFYLFSDLNVTDTPSDTVAPGKIVGIKVGCVEIATSTFAVEIAGLQGFSGELVQADTVLKQAGLKEGDCLQLADEVLQDADNLAQRFGRYENHWRQCFAETEPFVFPGQSATLNKGAGLSNSIDLRQQQIAFPAGLIDALIERRGVGNLPSSIATLYAAFLHRLGDSESFDLDVSFNNDLIKSSVSDLFFSAVPEKFTLDNSQTMAALLESEQPRLAATIQKSLCFSDLAVRYPELKAQNLSVGFVWQNQEVQPYQMLDKVLLFAVKPEVKDFCLHFCPVSFSEQQIERLSTSLICFLNCFLENFLSDSSVPLAQLELVDETQKRILLHDWNQTEKKYPSDRCVHQLFEEQVAQQPSAAALAFRDQELSYAELHQRSDQVAVKLQQLGAGPDVKIGLYIERSLEMVIGLLGILKSGAAYVPLDPAYPSDRVALMIDDAHLDVVLTHSASTSLLPSDIEHVVCIDLLDNSSDALQLVSVKPSNLAYMIYTSGSTGRPKGVMVEHRNVLNFFAGMDDTLQYQGEPGVWLAVTSISFDISVLEIFWSLSRGFKVVVQEEPQAIANHVVSKIDRKLDVGLFYFSSDAGESDNKQRYNLLLEGAKFADKHDFSSVWTPERHFHLFGGLYPNPSVTSAAIAAVTHKISIRAGSVVLPLHNPIRVAEEWSVVDNLSGGRIGFSFASGWHANDFSLMPENYENRKAIMFEGIEKIKRLWQGEAVEMKNGQGEPFSAKMYPPPVQKEPPMWITSAGNVDSFKAAGEGGFNVLTNLLGQSIEDIQSKIAAYREGRAEAGHSGEGSVAVMVHTFIGTDVDEVREIVRKPFSNYLKTSFDLVKIAPWAFPAFRQPSKDAAQDSSFDPDSLTEDDLDALLDHAFERYFQTAGIFGTPESCLPLIDQLKSVGVDEIACLIDFGVEEQQVLDSLIHLDRLRQLANNNFVGKGSHSSTEAAGNLAEDYVLEDYAIESQVARHGVTHFQCTPSMARILSSDIDALKALGGVNKWLLGGEALPADLAATLTEHCAGDVINVYGPTETTIWSTSASVPKGKQKISIGRPIANTSIYVLDSQQQLVPSGMPGELCIGGAGVVRGYFDRPELTAERFLQNPFSSEDDRLYRTGDLVQYLDDGSIEYLGRLDNQVKLRGYRIELGEIESIICSDPNVSECVVIASCLDEQRSDEQEQADSLLAYWVEANASIDTANAQLISPAISGTALDVASESRTQHWQALWDETYKAGSEAVQGVVSPSINDPTFNISGWLDSFSGEMHAESHMREWLDATVERILVHRPRRVLEIGCGTGMILYRVAPHCEQYVGVDLSEHALGLIRQQSDAMGLQQVSLVQSAADTVDLTSFEPFDMVVINSVIQYFPSLDYLQVVLKRISSVLAEKGRLFIGDVRSYEHLSSFHCGLEFARAADHTSLPVLRDRLEARATSESELLIAPDFFRNAKLLENLFGTVNKSHVDIQLKRGLYNNEMSCFRYDVTIELACEKPVLEASTLKILEVPQSKDALKALIADAANYKQSFVLRDIVNPRLNKHVLAERLLADAKTDSANVEALRATVAARIEPGIDPEIMYQLGEEWDVTLEFAQSGRLDAYDAYFIPTALQSVLVVSPNTADGTLSSYANTPLSKVDATVVVERVRALLKSQLPDFMVPSDFILLPTLPLTPNGKIDRKALPKPEKRQRDAVEAFVAPQSDIECSIAEVLQEMLNLERVGVNDNFFELGANSLLIVQANNRLRQTLSSNVSLVNMYRYPTVSSLAEFLSGNTDTGQSVTRGQSRAEKRRSVSRGRGRQKNR